MDDAAPQQPPATIEAFRDRLGAVLDSLPRRLRQCADHIAANTDRISVSTVAELAAGADVPPSAVMRFCRIMGFTGFSDMQRLFRDAYSPRWPDYSNRLRALQDAGAGSAAALLAEFVEAGRLSLEALAQGVDTQALTGAVAALSGAGTVHVVGVRRAYPVAAYLAYVLEKMQVPAMLHDGVGRLDHRFALRANDAVIAISFAPYSAETIALAADGQARGLPVVALTDSPVSALACHASSVLVVSEVDFGAFRSLSATIALALALAVAVGSARDGKDGLSAQPEME